MRDWVFQHRAKLYWSGVLVAVLMLASIVLQPVLRQLRVYNTEIDRDHMTLLRLTAIDVSKELIVQAAETFDQEDLRSWVYAKDLPSAQISLDIQKRVVEIIEQSGAAVESVSPASESKSGYQGAGIKVSFSGSLESAILAIGHIEDGQPLVVIEELDIRPKRVRIRRGEAQPQLTQVRLTAMTYTPVESADAR